MSTLALLAHNDNHHDNSVVKHRYQSLYFSLCVIMVFVLACFGLAEIVNSMRFDTTQVDKDVARQLSLIVSKLKNNTYLKEQEQHRQNYPRIGVEDVDYDKGEDVFVQFLRAVYQLQLQIVEKRDRKLTKEKIDEDTRMNSTSDQGINVGDSMGANFSGSSRSGRKSRSTQNQEDPEQIENSKKDVLSSYKNVPWNKTIIELLFIIFAVCISVIFIFLILCCADQCLTPDKKKCQRCSNMDNNSSNTNQNQEIKGQDFKCEKCAFLDYDSDDSTPPVPKRIKIYHPSQSSV